ncbi:ABC transporter permease [Candidatus Caldatribacterium sp.]|uniref:ABC transporter permease n=1 Tax=Candidatus Caldatribacterium sp. TaxID=2282143 RepID=UPI0038409F4A|nr:ABC transporter permease [Candidatus Caldatribacterium sp.]
MRTHWFMTIANALLVLYILLPIALILVGSFGKKWFGSLLPQGFTLEWYKTLFEERMYLRSLRMSVFVGVLTVLCTTLLSLPSVYAVYVSRKRMLRLLLDMTVILPVALPPIVLGIGLVQAYNWPSFSLVGTWQLLLFAHVLYSLPFMVKPIMANLDLLDWNTLEEAAESLGASRWYAFKRVLLPNLKPGILSGSIMTFAFSFGEFQLALILTSSASQTYPVVLYQAFYVSTGFACAAVTLLVLLAVLAIWLLTRFSKGALRIEPLQS